MWSSSLFLAAALVAPSYALHFFIDGAATKCFFEELPKDTLVQGTTVPPITFPTILSWSNFEGSLELWIFEYG
jgi:hypothetical protein